MRSFVLFLALAVPAAAASAAPTTTDPHPSKISTQSRRAQWVRLSFHNTSVLGRVLTIGESSYLVPMGKTLDLDVTTGSTVQQSSPWDSRVSGQLLQVTAADANRTVILQ